jgi:hypothetical protein
MKKRGSRSMNHYMIRLNLIGIFCLFLLITPQQILSADFTSKGLWLGIVNKGVEYHLGGRPVDFNPESVGLPRKFIVDFSSKMIRPTKDSVVQKRSKIMQIKHIENKVILQGVNDGVEGVNDGIGWSMSISKKTGKFVISASGDRVGYIVFGICRRK